MPIRHLRAERSGPVLVGVDLPTGTVRVHAQPDCETAHVEVYATTDAPELADVLRRVELRWEESGTLLVQVPKVNARGATMITHGGDITVLQSVGTVVAGGAVTGLIIDSSDDTVRLDGGSAGAVVCGEIVVTATVPEGSSVDMRGRSASLDAVGELAVVTTRTVSGRVQAGGVQMLTATSTSGEVSADAVDRRASIETVSGAIRLGRADAHVVARSTSGAIALSDFAGHAELETTRGSISVHAAERGSIWARSRSGGIRVTAAPTALAEGLNVDASSVTGHVSTPQQHPTTTRARRPRR